MMKIKLPKRHTYRISYEYKMVTLFSIDVHSGFEDVKAFTKKGAVRKFKRSLYKYILKNLVIKEVEVIG